MVVLVTLLVVEAVIVPVEVVLTVVDVKVIEVEARNVDAAGLCPKVVGKVCMNVLVNAGDTVFVLVTLVVGRVDGNVMMVSNSLVIEVMVTVLLAVEVDVPVFVVEAVVVTGTVPT